MVHAAGVNGWPPPTTFVVTARLEVGNRLVLTMVTPVRVRLSSTLGCSISSSPITTTTTMVWPQRERAR
ncbi:hypothetical protein TIFTF001_005071 [Ficus carica]|uniref:Uncharacterized protein n=1 Tax=Ficus carica TaxID=3494 RepID=A0AA87ZL73_FICCA|nr:hypothetical protein TIFTF001_005071 [Ficus carica]